MNYTNYAIDRQGPDADGVYRINKEAVNAATAADIMEDRLIRLASGEEEPAGQIFIEKIPNENWEKCYGTTHE